MNVNLTPKERTLLEDQRTHEEICIQKYSNYANLASNQQLKELFSNHAQIEQEHLISINQLLNGQVPAMNQQGGGQQQQGQQQQQQMLQQQMQQQMQQQPNIFQQQNANLQSDKDLCTDMLMTEKYVSNAYDTAIFEFKDTQVRDVLNHIQKEEQKHGEAIFKFMESNGLYSAQ
ncbi:MAG: spore coat protein [Bacillota bacterium]